MQLSRKNFLVKKIKAAEVLGNATVILTDKTGTITENRMRVAAIYPPQAEKEVLAAAGEAMSDTSVSPTDRAIAEKIGQDQVPATRQPDQSGSAASATAGRPAPCSGRAGADTHCT